VSVSIEAPGAGVGVKGRSERVLFVAYTGAIFTSAFLLFLVQPMIAKAILPSFGGAPSVWITAMLFFQAALLVGYLFVHVGSTRLTPEAYRLVHLSVLVLAALTLPVGIRVAPPLEQTTPTGWVMLMLLLGVGAPFFALSMSSPALQRWFSLSGHSRAGDPYFLYVASNAGSLAALLAYPLVIERFLPLDFQEYLWSGAFIAFIALSASCSRYIRSESAAQAVRTLARSSWSDRSRWAALAFVPCALMLGVTNFISSEIAALPLFWVLPLAAYLVTFMISFSARPLISPAWAAKATPFAVLVAIPALLPGILPVWLVIPIHLAVLLIAGTAIHGRLAALRPQPEQLAEFYVFLSLGGVLGAVFAALVAPHVFVVVIEYPLFLGLAYLVSRSTVGTSRAGVGPVMAAAGLVLLATTAIAVVLTGRLEATTVAASAPAVALIGALLLAGSRRSQMPIVLMSLLGVLLLASQATSIHSERTFFGTLRVREIDGGTQRVLMHGTTDHGRQNVRPDQRRVPLTYYSRSGPVGDIFTLWRDGATDVGVIGLGVGTLAAYGRPGERYTFFELDPAVVDVARNPSYFTYLEDSRADVRVVVGDGRLATERMRDGAFDLFVVDAFSSDVIPTHLLTREALALYTRKVSAEGLIAFNVSSRYFDLAPVVAASAAELGLISVQRLDLTHGTGAQRGKHPSIWVVVARRRSAVAPLLATGRWKTADTGSGWTDSYSNPLRSMMW
jgi:hypothetical protein